ncbi:hypothetical protein AO072_05415 [Pseudomonas syringae ICMP 13102]|uniref:hypothetical protein n=1 Tax=Pseudomonas syringae TaxID=317 RepID=UPI0007312B00|nr:hypothetical protein [Pseudomonas syringae]KTB75770.1 hypothetical protein AO072_05415 [Pseudomonas syringae ICMP 13102]
MLIVKDDTDVGVIALKALLGAMREMREGRVFEHRGELLDHLQHHAEQAGIAYGSPLFDQAAEKAGLFYSRNWDLYVEAADLEFVKSFPSAHPSSRH